MKWTAEHCDCNSYEWWIIRNEEGTQIAELSEENANNNDHARLIAIAPELLEQLEKVTTQFELLVWDERVFQEAKTVIAKAKGALEDK